MPLLGATVTDATLEPEGRLRMALYDHTGTTYALDLQLAALVNVTSDWWRVLPREVLLTVQKRSAGPYWRHLLRDGRRPPTMSIDWSRWVDEARDGVRWNELADRRWDWWTGHVHDVRPGSQMGVIEEVLDISERLPVRSEEEEDSETDV